MAVRIQVRRDSFDNWKAANPVLASGEIGFISDRRQAKIGDGVTEWNTLGFLVGGSEAEIIAKINQNTSAIATEANARSSGDAQLQSNLNAESAARSEADNELSGRILRLETADPDVPEGLAEQVQTNTEAIQGLVTNDENLAEAINGKLGLPQGELTELNINDWLIIGRTDPNTGTTPTYLSRLSTLKEEIGGGSSEPPEGYAELEKQVADNTEAIANGTEQLEQIYGRLDALESAPGGGGIEEAPVDGEQYARKDAAWSVVDVDAPLHLEFEWQGEEWWPDKVKEGEMFGHKSESSLFFSETDENGLNVKTIMTNIVSSGTTVFVTKTKDRSRWAHFTARSRVNDNGSFLNLSVNLNAKSEKEIKKDDDVTVMFNVSAPTTIPEMIPAERVTEMEEVVAKMKKELTALKGQVTRLKNGNGK